MTWRQAPRTAVRISRRALLGLGLTVTLARAMGRAPVGGVVRTALPFSLAKLDPYSATDPASAFFGSAVADPLFASDGGDRVHPALAMRLPESHPEGAVVTLRHGLTTARGRALSAKDVVWSLERAAAGAGQPLLVDWGKPRAIGALEVLVPFGKGKVAPNGPASADTLALAAALANPVTAILSRQSSVTAPDGTGAFGATLTPGKLALTRNPRAARGAAFLERIEVTEAKDLSTSLRAFEAGDAEVGFLGAGLHGRRPGAEDVALPPVGYIVLRTGPEAGAWGASGVARALVEPLDPTPFYRLGLRTTGTRDPTRLSQGWGGAAAELLVDEASAYLVEVAKVLAAGLRRERHEVTVRPVGSSALRGAIRDGRFSLALDFVRESETGSLRRSMALLHAVDPRLVRSRSASRSAIEGDPDVTRRLPLAVLAELAFVGARAADVHGLESRGTEAPDLGSVYRSGT